MTRRTARRAGATREPGRKPSLDAKTRSLMPFGKAHRLLFDVQHVNLNELAVERLRPGVISGSARASKPSILGRTKAVPTADWSFERCRTSKEMAKPGHI